MLSVNKTFLKQYNLTINFSTSIDVQIIFECSCCLLRCKYGYNSVFDSMASYGPKNNNSMGYILPEFNSHLNGTRIALCFTFYDFILAYIWNVITNYYIYFIDGIFIHHTFYSMAVLIYGEIYSSKIISVCHCERESSFLEFSNKTLVRYFVKKKKKCESDIKLWKCALNIYSSVWLAIFIVDIFRYEIKEETCTVHHFLTHSVHSVKYLKKKKESN